MVNRDWCKSAARPWDPPLTALGHAQATAAGRALRRQVDGNALLFSSPLQRTVETSERIAAELGIDRIHVEPVRVARERRAEGHPAAAASAAAPPPTSQAGPPTPAPPARAGPRRSDGRRLVSALPLSCASPTLRPVPLRTCAAWRCHTERDRSRARRSAYRYEWWGCTPDHAAATMHGPGTSPPRLAHPTLHDAPLQRRAACPRAARSDVLPRQICSTRRSSCSSSCRRAWC